MVLVLVLAWCRCLIMALMLAMLLARLRVWRGGRVRMCTRAGECCSRSRRRRRVRHHPWLQLLLLLLLLRLRKLRQFKQRKVWWPARSVAVVVGAQISPPML